MALHRALARKLVGVPLALLCMAAFGGDGINLTVTNDGIVDIYVTVYDVSTKPTTAVASHQRINGFTSIPISVSADASGRANISWTAVGVDSRDQRCGHGTGNSLTADANVNVHADSDCGS